MIQVSGEDYNRLPSCLNYVRSAIDVNPVCKFGPAQQVIIHLPAFNVFIELFIISEELKHKFQLNI